MSATFTRQNLVGRLLILQLHRYYATLTNTHFVQILIVLCVLEHLLSQVSLISLDMCADILETTLLHGPTDIDLEIKRKLSTLSIFYWISKGY